MNILIDDEYTDKATERLGASIVDTPVRPLRLVGRPETSSYIFAADWCQPARMAGSC